MLGGEPGIGKSTLLLQVSASMERSGRSVIYVSGEESLSQIRGRAERLNMLSGGLTAMATNQVEDILVCMEKNPALIVVDSVQTMVSNRVEGLPGSVSQVRAVATALVERAKQTGTTVILVGHVTKDGQIAGPKLLEHMVDTVLYLEGDKEHLFRILRVVKNRFGPSNEILLFEMKEQGMQVIEDPSTFFLQARDKGPAQMHRSPAAFLKSRGLGPATFGFSPAHGPGFDANRLHLLTRSWNGCRLTWDRWMRQGGGGLR